MENKDNLNDYQCKAVGLSGHEKRRAGVKFREYQKIYHIESFSDLQLLEELVYRETLQEIYKKTILGEGTEENQKEEQKKQSSNRRIQNNLNDNLEQILILKEKLGLFEDKKNQDEFKAFQVLEKKFDVWKENHIEERKVTCPFCSQIFFLNIRTKGFTESKLKLFKNKVICNAGLWKIYKEKKITKEEFADILNVSKDYIDWLEKKIYNNPSK